MALRSSHFKSAEDAPGSSGPKLSLEEIPQEYLLMIGGVLVFAVFFLIGVIWYWRKLKREAVPEF